MKKQLKKLYIVLTVFFVLSLALMGLPELTLANGGTIIFSKDVGPFNVLVTEIPSPPSPDTPVHLSVLLTKASSDHLVSDASIIFTPVMSGMGMPASGSRRSFPGQSPNTYDVDLPMAMEGDWAVHVQIHSPSVGDANLDLNLKVEKPSPPWPFIIGIVVGLPVLAALTWWLLFRKGDGSDDDDESGGGSLKTKPLPNAEQSGKM